jgi:hypothetical protein
MDLRGDEGIDRWRLTFFGGRGLLGPVGKHDNRNSMKMKRRKGQVKKKARLKRKRTASAKPVTTKKAAAKKSAPPKAQA